MTEPQIEQRPAQAYLGIAGRITDGVPAFVDKAFPELFRWLGEHGIEPSGPPFIRFRELDTQGEPLEIEVAAPVEPRRRATRGSKREPSQPADTSPSFTAAHTAANRRPTSPPPASN